MAAPVDLMVFQAAVPVNMCEKIIELGEAQDSFGGKVTKELGPVIDEKNAKTELPISHPSRRRPGFTMKCGTSFRKLTGENSNLI